jgi:hypothetical protein
MLDLSGMGPGADHVVTGDDDGKEEDNGQIVIPGDTTYIRLVRNLSLAYFRGRLVEHFVIIFHQNKVKWPT